jgi:glycosyltransferase involved in cell wall biosynthesis
MQRRIAVLLHSLRRGGAERIALELAKGLLERGHYVEIIQLVSTDEYTEDRYKHIPRTALMDERNYRGFRSVLLMKGTLRELIKRRNFEVLHINDPLVYWIASRANPNIPKVHVIHGHTFKQNGPILKYLVRRTLDRHHMNKSVTRMLAVSRSLVEASAKHYGIHESNVECVHNGVDLNQYPFGSAKAPSNLTVVMVGTLSAEKGQLLGIKSFAALTRSIPDAKMLVVGSGSILGELKKYAEENCPTDSVQFLGTRSDVNRILRQSAIFWTGSVSEGLPMTVLEAMAMGLPVLGFRVPGVSETVADGLTGVLVEYGDIADLADQTMRIWKNRSEYTEMSAAARRRVELYFNLEHTIRKHEGALLQALRANLH